MENRNLIGKLKRAITLQIDLFKSFQREEELLKDYLFKREWGGLEATIWRMDHLSGRMEEFETERAEVFAKLAEGYGLAKNAGPYEVMGKMEPDQRNELTDLYRKLKMAVLSMKCETEAMDDYLKTTTDVVREMLGELYPYRKGRLYSRHGTAQNADSRSMVLNRNG
ncbi:MAG: hypothetical protein K9L68_03150 [Spirochaetales bacterium]|nr:hypothetical protein [Spirochaetales bacterium]MCF7937574.1 hypothetical protein [Spirochaetales bacterium]